MKKTYKYFCNECFTFKVEKVSDLCDRCQISFDWSNQTKTKNILD